MIAINKHHGQEVEESEGEEDDDSGLDIHVSGFKDDNDLLPSHSLDVHVTRLQCNFLNPTPQDVQRGEIISQCHGEKAMKKIAKRRVDFVSGNVNSYARLLNGAEQIKDIQDANSLAVSMSVFTREKARFEEEKRVEKKRIEEGKAAKKRAREDKEKADRDMLFPGCKDDVELRGKAYVLGCNLKRKKQIIKYYFEHKGPLSNLKVSDTDDLIEKFFSEMTDAHEEGTSVAAGDDAAGDTEVNRALQVMIESVGEAEGLDQSVDEAEEPRRTGRKRKRTERGEDYAESRM